MMQVKFIGLLLAIIPLAQLLVRTYNTNQKCNKFVAIRCCHKTEEHMRNWYPEGPLS